MVDMAPAARSEEPTGRHVPFAPILVVEDDSVSAAVVAHHLHGLGLANPVQVIGDGDEALAWLAQAIDADGQGIPALVLLDRHLPGASGLDILRWMHRQPCLAGVPVILLTAASDVEAISEAYALGARSYLVKPIGLEAMGEIVRGLELRWAILRPEGPA